MLRAEDFLKEKNPIASHYKHFHVEERLLLTGHSHQAWPDAALEAQKEYFLDSARYIDDKWELIFEKYNRVCQGYADIMSDNSGDYVLGSNTHELLVRFLSAMDLKNRPHIVTTDGEFHSARRQLTRLAEVGIRVTYVHRHPIATLSERMAKEIHAKTAAVVVSSVFFETAEVLSDFRPLIDACEKSGAHLLVDAYHSLNVSPFSIPALDLERAFITGGGYKYMQLGEGVCFLRIPKNVSLSPIITGWFAEFENLHNSSIEKNVFYGKGASRFYGSTFDGTSVYRAARVLDFFKTQGLTPELLRAVSLKHMQILTDEFIRLSIDPKKMDFDRTLHPEKRAGFLSLKCGEKSSEAQKICDKLKTKGVLTDCRGNHLRFGPAPYLNPQQLREAIQILKFC